MFLNSSFLNTYVANIMMYYHLLRIKNNDLQQLHCQQKVIVPADLTIHLKAVSFLFIYATGKLRVQLLLE